MYPKPNPCLITPYVASRTEPETAVANIVQNLQRQEQGLPQVRYGISYERCREYGRCGNQQAGVGPVLIRSAISEI